MTAHNRHLLAEGAYKANRDAAAREEREAVVKFVRRQAAESSEFTADVLRVLALVIENGDHLR